MALRGYGPSLDSRVAPLRGIRVVAVLLGHRPPRPRADLPTSSRKA